MSLALAALLVIVGLVTGLGPMTTDTWAAVARQVTLGAMTAAIAAPVAWAATLGRSVLAGVSVSIGIVVVAQVSVLAGIGGWMPLASPALWAISSGEDATSGQLLLVIPVLRGMGTRHSERLADDATRPPTSDFRMHGFEDQRL